ncbi:MAG: hypothetical protein ACJAYB_002417 [Psychromonas sp.]|jgi:hypothetical protein
MWVLDSMGFNMFSKKKKDIQGKLTVFHLKLNVDEISTYLKGKCVVTPDKGNNWKRNDKVKSYDITYLGTDPFLFYHKNANEFASSINGRDCVNDGEIDIEWEWVEGYFLATANNQIIFCAPELEIIQLMVNGKLESDNIKKSMQGEVIELDLGIDNVNAVHKSHVFRDGVVFSNRLASLSVCHSRANDFVHYHE